MSKHFKCWCCDEVKSPLFTKGFGSEHEIRVCGSCIGTLAAIDVRLNELSKNGKLSKCSTADNNDVPRCERD